jgi:hypothetical protein
MGGYFYVYSFVPDGTNVLQLLCPTSKTGTPMRK